MTVWGPIREQHDWRMDQWELSWAATVTLWQTDISWVSTECSQRSHHIKVQTPPSPHSALTFPTSTILGTNQQIRTTWWLGSGSIWAIWSAIRSWQGDMNANYSWWWCWCCYLISWEQWEICVIQSQLTLNNKWYDWLVLKINNFVPCIPVYCVQ